MMVITQKITSMAFEIHDGELSIWVRTARGFKSIWQMWQQSFKTAHALEPAANGPVNQEVNIDTVV